MDREFVNDRVRMLAFAAMVFVTIIHSITYSSLASPAIWNVFVQRFVGSCMTCWAVPFFFAVSGYYFGRYCSGTEGTMAFYRKKVRSLLIPYLLWVSIVTLLTLPLFVGNNWIMHRGLFERTVFDCGSWWGGISGFLGVLDAPRGNFPLWYVRALLIFFALAPIFRLAKRLCNRYVLLVIALALCLVRPNAGISPLAIKVSAVGYFTLGLALYGREPWLNVSGGWTVALSALFYFAVSVVHTMAGLNVGWALPRVLTAKMYDVMPFLGILFWWGLACTVLKRLKVREFMRRTFWVYCLHNAIVGYCLSGGGYLLGKTNGVSIVLFLITPWVAIGVCLMLSYLISSRWPRIYAVLTGGRG